MKSIQNRFEKTIHSLFVKKAPFQLSKTGVEAVASWIPYIALFVGILSIVVSIGLAGQIANTKEAIQNTGRLSQNLPIDLRPENINPVVYVAVISAAAQGLVLISSFLGLKSRKKHAGWDLLLLSMIIGFIYAVLTLFMAGYRTNFDFILSMLSTVAGLYILAQIRPVYK